MMPHKTTGPSGGHNDHSTTVGDGVTAGERRAAEVVQVPATDPDRFDRVHQALHKLGVRIPNLAIEGCHCQLVTRVVLDEIDKTGREGPRVDS